MGFDSPPDYNMCNKPKSTDPDYWKDWYWNRGGREKVKKSRASTEKKNYHKPGYWKKWYWEKGGREKVQARRTSEEGRLKEKIQRLQRAGLKVV